MFTFRKLMHLYYLNVDHLENSYYKHYSILNKRFSELLMTDDHLFQGFTSISLSKPNMSGKEDSIYWFEDSCILEIFDNVDVYKKRLQKSSFINVKLRKIILKYIDIYFEGNKQTVKLENDEDIFMKNWWSILNEQIKNYYT